MAKNTSKSNIILELINENRKTLVEMSLEYDKLVKNHDEMYKSSEKVYMGLQDMIKLNMNTKELSSSIAKNKEACELMRTKKKELAKKIGELTESNVKLVIANEKLVKQHCDYLQKKKIEICQKIDSLNSSLQKNITSIVDEKLKYPCNFIKCDVTVDIIQRIVYEKVHLIELNDEIEYLNNINVIQE